MKSKMTLVLMQIALLIFFLLQIPARLYPAFHPDLLDGVQGLFLGMAIGLLIVSGWKNCRRTA